MDGNPEPNPGSQEAILRGCCCPIFDNNRGLRPPWTGAWWIHADCPLHAGPFYDFPRVDSSQR